MYHIFLIPSSVVIDATMSVSMGVETALPDSVANLPKLISQAVMYEEAHEREALLVRLQRPAVCKAHMASYFIDSILLKIK